MVLCLDNMENTLSYEAIKDVTEFLLNYSEQNELLLPGWVPGYTRSDIKLLPSSVSSVASGSNTGV